MLPIQDGFGQSSLKGDAVQMSGSVWAAAATTTPLHFPRQRGETSTVEPLSIATK